MLSLERLERLRTASSPMQRIGLSATQRPLSEIAEFLGGYHKTDEGFVARSIEIIDAAERKTLELAVEMVDSEGKDAFGGAPAYEPNYDAEAGGFFDDGDELPEDIAPEPATGKTVWPGMHERLVELIESHRSTIIFVNSRRLSERLTSAINECAGKTIAHAHHGSPDSGSARRPKTF